MLSFQWLFVHFVLIFKIKQYQWLACSEEQHCFLLHC